MSHLYTFRSLLKKLINNGKLNASKKDFSRITYDADQTSQWIATKILSKEPFIVSRFGNVELEWYLQLKIMRKNVFKRIYSFITFDSDVWRQKDKIIKHTYFVPSDLENSLFYESVMDEVIPEIDFLASWLKGETSNYVKLKKDIPKSFIFDIEPYKSNKPWTLALEGKKVLVINPMVDIFEKQLLNREKLFDFPMLPTFELIKIKALFFRDPVFTTWKSVYEYYKVQISKIDFDVAIIGCGTWGMPISKIVKDKGKGAIHLGGATQIMFGVMGKRWKDWPEYTCLVNNYWMTKHNEKPEVASKIEDGCYW
jgi:hypothetical protein